MFKEEILSLTIFRASFWIPSGFDREKISSEFIINSIHANMSFATFSSEVLEEVFDADWLANHFDEDAPYEGPEPCKLDLLEFSIEGNCLYISANLSYKVSLNPNYLDEDQLNEALETPGDIVDNFSLWPTDCDDEFEYQGHSGITYITILKS